MKRTPPHSSPPFEKDPPSLPPHGLPLSPPMRVAIALERIAAALEKLTEEKS